MTPLYIHAQALLIVSRARRELNPVFSKEPIKPVEVEVEVEVEVAPKKEKNDAYYGQYPKEHPELKSLSTLAMINVGYFFPDSKGHNTEEQIRIWEEIHNQQVEIFSEHKEPGLYLYENDFHLKRKKHSAHLKVIREAKKKYPDLIINKNNTLIEWSDNHINFYTNDIYKKPAKCLYYKLYLK